MLKKSFLFCLFYFCANADDFQITKSVDPLYQKECGSCHMAFQPELLNKDSWAKIMDNLQDHFKTDASLEPQDTQTLKTYLLHASQQYMHNPKKEIAITKMPWFVKEHRELSPKIIAHPKVKTLSNCMACHTQAASGNYEEETINVPGVGRWEE